MCGESLPELSTESITHCPVCEFDLSLLVSPQKSEIPRFRPAYVPRLAYGLIGAQIVLSGILAAILFIFASSLYLGVPQTLAALQIVAIVTTSLIALHLRQQRGLVVIRIGLVLVGILSLPPGAFSIAAALAISPFKRWCTVCGKQIRWSAFIECNHCQSSMHRWGSCRNKRLEAVIAASEPGASSAQIEWTCPNCHKLMAPQYVGGNTSD
ncbi:MAG: hypothetical protein ACFE9D_05110 [Promethearchaeota archaeon]